MLPETLAAIRGIHQDLLAIGGVNLQHGVPHDGRDELGVLIDQRCFEKIQHDIRIGEGVVAANDDFRHRPFLPGGAFGFESAAGQEMFMINADAGNAVSPGPPGTERLKIGDNQVGLKGFDDL